MVQNKKQARIVTDLSGQRIPGATFAQAPVRPGAQTTNDAWYTNISNTLCSAYGL